MNMLLLFPMLNVYNQGFIIIRSCQSVETLSCAELRRQTLFCFFKKYSSEKWRICDMLMYDKSEISLKPFKLSICQDFFFKGNFMGISKKIRTTEVNGNFIIPKWPTKPKHRAKHSKFIISWSKTLLKAV